MSEPEAPKKKKWPWYEVITGRVQPGITSHWMLSKMCFAATKLWNTAMWQARADWEQKGITPSGYELQARIQGTHWYSILQSHAAQKTIHEVGEAFRSWFKLRKKDTTARPPGFRSKERLSPVTFDRSGFRFCKRTNALLLSLGPEQRKELDYPHKFLALHVDYWRPIEGEVVEVSVIPRDGFFEVHAKVKLPEPKWRTEGQVKTIDLGMRNPAAIAAQDGSTELYKGGGILQTLHYWNKEKGRVQGEVMERSDGKKKWSSTLVRMSQRAARQVKHAVHGLSSRIVEACRKDTKEVVVGDLKGLKKEPDGTGKNWRDKSSQNWQQFPTRELVAQLRYKLARLGIRLVEQDERGTSRGRCSLCGCTDRKKLHRVHRGIFRCENCNTWQNADINGARNQLARYLHQEVPIGISEGSSGALAAPSVLRWNGHCWSTAVVG